MYNRLSIFLVGAILPWLMVACSDSNDPEEPPSVPDVELADNVLVFTDQQIPNFYLQQAIDEGEEDPTARLRGDIMGRAIVIVKLSGKASHVGVDISVSPPKYIPYDATVPQTGVWIAEHPETRNRQLQTDDTGWWTMYIVKDAEADLEFSFVYEKEGWPTTKTNINTITDEDDTDFGIQRPISTPLPMRMTRILVFS
ncbi:MAG: hypothetical protein KDI17_16030 [Halioglobus sp.]|nr:hypothetical protein [Halioglobus sp.]